MKHLNVLCLLMGLTVLFGCSKDNATLVPDSIQSDQETAYFKAEKIPFTGTSTIVAPIDPGTTQVLPNGKIKIKNQVAEWFENSEVCEMVTGQSFWYANWLIAADGSGAKIWGKAEINVGVLEEGDDVLGTWELSWHGWVTEGEMGPAGFIKGLITVEAVGTGKSGAVKGMVGHWTYTMSIEDGFVYATEGFIK